MQGYWRSVHPAVIPECCAWATNCGCFDGGRAGRGRRATANAPSLSRGGSDGPELVGCVSCASCAVLSIEVTSYKLQVTSVILTSHGESFITLSNLRDRIRLNHSRALAR
eukprot:2108648-Prymnesium_polylepis.1